jgi:DNA-directed RNA polymerase subunit RPC12/RpoP
MTKCPGKITQLCGAILYKCSKCGAVGYDKKGCSNQKFDGSRCLLCGKVGTKKPL